MSSDQGPLAAGLIQYLAANGHADAFGYAAGLPGTGALRHEKVLRQSAWFKPSLEFEALPAFAARIVGAPLPIAHSAIEVPLRTNALLAVGRRPGWE